MNIATAEYDARIDSEESEAALDCGCILKWVDDFGVTFTFCAAHRKVGNSKDTFTARLAERIAEFEAERDKMPMRHRLIINRQIGLIQAIAHDYTETL